MDKKKVKELIERGISYLNRSSYITSYKDDARECFKEAINELSKSDWISVEDRLPEYEENVWVRDKDFPDDIYTTYRYKGCEESYAHDRYGFKAQYSVTHWKPIEKLKD